MQRSRGATLNKKKPVINRKNLFWAHLKRDAGLYLLLAPVILTWFVYTQALM